MKVQFTDTSDIIDTLSNTPKDKSKTTVKNVCHSEYKESSENENYAGFAEVFAYYGP